jgi:peptidoglycan/LPS O-acetylase OafA/YrhL
MAYVGSPPHQLSLYHLLGRTDAGWLAKSGYLGVAVFFVLSGYVITMAVGTNKITLGFLGRFAARRSLRLDPPYWVNIAVVIALMLVAARVGVEKPFPSASTIFVNLIYLQDLLGVQALSSVYWTLCLEVQFYLVLILLLATRWPITFVCGLLGWSLLEHANKHKDHARRRFGAIQTSAELRGSCGQHEFKNLCRVAQ